MTVHQPALPNAPIASRSGVFRLKALFSEERARAPTDQTSRKDWEELAIEWHMMAHLAASANDENLPVGIVRR